MKVHLLPRPDSQITACRKYGLFDEEDIIKYGWTKAQQLERGGTHDVKEVTCEYCLKEILLSRFKRGLITL